jgi:O-methyltransferase
MFKKAGKSIFSALGLEVRRRPASNVVKMPVELSVAEQGIIDYVQEHQLSMTSNERLWATLMACKHVIERGIEGDFVECGVWRGGNAFIAASIFKLYGESRRVYLFDTFGGMTAPTEKDKRVVDDTSAMDVFRQNQKDTHNEWCYASIEDVRNNFSKAGLLRENVVFVEGDVVKTLDDDANLPSQISVLRLDTDWYESTLKELEVLYPRLGLGGVLIVDDYGHWAGAKQATDEYFTKHQNRPFLQYTDYSGRVAVKFEA